jgi:hypothetical protein
MEQLSRDYHSGVHPQLIMVHSHLVLGTLVLSRPKTVLVICGWKFYAKKLNIHLTLNYRAI